MPPLLREPNRRRRPAGRAETSLCLLLRAHGEVDHPPTCSRPDAEFASAKPSFFADGSEGEDENYCCLRRRTRRGTRRWVEGKKKRPKEIMKNTYQRKIAALIPDCHFWSSRVVARIPPVVNPNLFRLLSCTHADILILLYAVTSNSSAHTMINQGENASNKKENTKTIKHIRHVKRCLYCVRSIANWVSSRLEIRT